MMFLKANLNMTEGNIRIFGNGPFENDGKHSGFCIS